MLCGCFLRRCMLFRSILVLFFLRFWLRLETTSRWVGSAFSCQWCCFPRRWFAVNSLCLSWFSRSVFGDLTSMLFFHSSRMAQRFVDFILSIFISLFSHLAAPFIADHVSCGSPFRHICYSRCFRCFRHASFCFVVTLFFRWLFFLWPGFLVFCAGAWSRSFVFWGSLCLIFYFFNFFLTSTCSTQYILW